MGIYDREYYRGDAGGRLAGVPVPSRACQWIIIANVIVFVVQLATRYHHGSIAGPVTDALSLRADQVLHGEVWRLVTYAFLHSSGWQHIVFNMLGIWWFGRAVEDICGHKEFLAFYLFSALFSGVCYCGYDLAVHGLDNSATAVGASGAVTAVMVLFAMHFPTATVLFMFIIPMPVITLVVLYVVVDVVGLMGGRQGEQIAFAAHLGGALFGFLYFRYHWRVLNWWPTRMSMRPRRLLRPRLRVYKPTQDDAAPDGDSEDDALEAELDAVLAKVARHGRESLTERENKILMKASEIYKQRRK